MIYKAATGVGCDGFQPKIPLDLSRETRGILMEFFGEGVTVWEMATTSLHDDVLPDLIPKKITSERPIALLPSIG